MVFIQSFTVNHKIRRDAEKYRVRLYDCMGYEYVGYRITGVGG